jgi:hypothetical protein
VFSRPLPRHRVAGTAVPLWPLFLTASISLVEPRGHLARLPLRQVLRAVHERTPVRIPHTPAIRVAGCSDDVAIFILHSAKMPGDRAINQPRSSLMGAIRRVCWRIGNYCELFGGAALARIWRRGAEQPHPPPISNPPSRLHSVHRQEQHLQQRVCVAVVDVPKP